MLYWLTEWLANLHPGFRVFGYLTLRAILAALTALLISLLVGPTMIRWLTQEQIGQNVRSGCKAARAFSACSRVRA